MIETGFLIVENFAVNYNFIKRVYLKCIDGCASIIVELMDNKSFEALKAPDNSDKEEEDFIQLQFVELLDHIQKNKSIDFYYVKKYLEMNEEVEREFERKKTKREGIKND